MDYVSTLDVLEWPAERPVTWELFSSHLRLNNDLEVVTCWAYLDAAIQYFEDASYTTLMAKKYRLSLCDPRTDSLGRAVIWLFRPPFVSVQKVTIQTGGAAVDLDDDEYTFDTADGRIRTVDTLPDLDDISPNVVIEYTAGYTDANLIRPTIKNALCQLGASNYLHREGEKNATTNQVEFGFGSVVRQSYAYRPLNINQRTRCC